jgi:hypothetical protein
LWPRRAEELRSGLTYLSGFPDSSDDIGLRNRPKQPDDPDIAKGREKAPIPGSVAASNRSSSCSDAAVLKNGGSTVPVQEYTGPAVLSRNYSNDDRYSLGHDHVTVVYDGSLSHSSEPGGYNGANNSLTVDYTYLITRHLLSQNDTLMNPSTGPETIANINPGISPNVQIPDTGTKQFTSTADIIWQKSSRLSFHARGSFFRLWQDSTSLHGVTGQQLSGDVTYRLTHRTTIGAYYSFTSYLYSRGFGISRINTAGLIYSYAFNRSTQLRLRGGNSRITSFGLQTVQIARPAAALLGVSPGVIELSLGSNVPDFSAQLVKDFGSLRTVSFGYELVDSPGNGVYMTSRQQSISVNFIARLRRTYLLSVGISRDSLESIMQVAGNYRSESATVQLSRAYEHGVGLSLALQYWYFDTLQFTSARNEFRITSGMTWRSGTGRPRRF